MLVIQKNHKSGVGGIEVGWHIREHLDVGYHEVPLVEEVQADGDELELVREICQNIPMTNGHVVRWFGDTAKFIVASLINYY
jgi:hypothetical protein